MSASTLASQRADLRVRGGLGEDTERPDGPDKAAGTFPFSSDLSADGMLIGRTLRSPHPHARIVAIDTSAARAMTGVRAVLTAADVPGRPRFGLEHPDQPVLASEVVRFQGEPVALVAAEHPELAARALEAIAVNYAPLPVLSDPEAAIGAPPIHPEGNVFRRLRLRHGDQEATGDVVVEGTYVIGMQDQAFLGPESGLAVPDGTGGVDLHVSTQWLHVDRDQVAASLALPLERVRLHLAGVGGAFGAREDVSLQVHACMLALSTGRPVHMQYSREESFLGHVHRHPAQMHYRHHATRAGELVKVEARILLDGGAYASTSGAVIGNATCFAVGPYRVRAAAIDGIAVRTNNPPCGAMRGFGAVQACTGHEAQMDRLAAMLGRDPVDLRLQNALAPGDRVITGQVITGTAPVREVIAAAAGHPLPPPADPARELELPGGTGRTAGAGNVVRGVGFAVGMKGLLFSEGFDDTSVARVRLALDTEGEPVAAVHCAAAEVGQGFVTLAQQIVRSELGVENVELMPADTSIGSAGSTSASRQTWMSGGAVRLACLAVREALLERAGVERIGIQPADGAGADELDGLDLGTLLAEGAVDVTRKHCHAPTERLDADGQGNAHASFAFAAHRAVVDVDADLGLVRVVEVATAQDVGRALNPTAVVGQIEGGIAQGVGLAVMEEVLVEGGVVRNPSFTDYLIPTTLDAPDVPIVLIEEPEPGAPYGAKGVGEPPTVSSTAAVVAAIRAATGLALDHVPVRPSDVALGARARTAD
jgi:xanthine dehydrogenase D subunit